MAESDIKIVDGAERPFRLSVELNVLNHLGINLYSNIAAVVSEIVANAWDADASNVRITLDRSAGSITITDDGIGMTQEMVNERYLNVGFQRRDVIGPLTQGGRVPMGRKGIGKLSLFSAARNVQIYTWQRDALEQAFEMRLDEIKKAIGSKSSDGANETYYPKPIEPIEKDRPNGTTIVLSDLRKGLSHTGPALRRRIARRFGIIGPETNFQVFVDDVAVTVADRDYFSKLQMMWYFGEDGKRFIRECKIKPNTETDERFLRYSSQRPSSTVGGAAVKGWIGTVFEPRQLKDADEDESFNHLVVFARGKLVQEDLLGRVNDGGLYTKYIVGEIHVDSLDIDEDDDITTSSRQQLIEGDPRFEDLRKFVREQMVFIEKEWGTKRRELALKVAFDSPSIKSWYEALPRAQREPANRILSAVGDVAVDREESRYDLYEHAILAFETLAVKERLEEIGLIDLSQLDAVAKLFAQVDDIEATRYHEITKLRLSAIDRVRQMVDQNAKEGLIQQELFNHLYLLDPSWEQATDELPDMERSFRKIFDEDGLSDKEKYARIDIKFKKTSGLHIVVELKRPDRVLSLAELIDQVSKYRSAMQKGLDARNSSEPFTIIVVLGKHVRDHDTPAGRKIVDETLLPHKARIVRYDELIDQAYAAYGSYLEQRAESGRVLKLVDKIRIEKADFIKSRDEAKAATIVELRKLAESEDEQSVA